MLRTALAALAIALTAAGPALAAPPVVVELYKAQGCSSCPPANAWLNGIAGRQDVLALSFAVTYWDRLGWKDRFAQPAFTNRQRAYAAAIGNRQLFTPEVVVNGRHDVIGSDRGRLEAALAAGTRDPRRAGVVIEGGHATVSGAPADAEVWLVRYDPRTIEVPIRAGENGGRTLPHRNIVRELVKLGRSPGSGVASYSLPAASDPALRTAVLVQAGPGGAIIGAVRA